jgi:hypothetical protein
MATITALCIHCYASSRLSDGEVVVRAQSADAAQLSFLCRRCESVSTAELTAELSAQLEAAGIALERSAHPHPEQPPPGPALIRDDLLDLHLLLATDRWFAALEQLVASRVL